MTPAKFWVGEPMGGDGQGAKDSPLNKNDSRDTIDVSIVVSRRELEIEHSICLERIHQLRRILNYPPLMTGKKQRES